MDRSSFVRALVLTIGVAGTFSSLADSALAGQCDNCDSPSSHSCKCPPGRGLLDTLNDVAGKLVKDKPQRNSILHAFKFKLQVTSDCDKPSCGCEPACGVEPSCGTEPTCGTEASCGVEPGCGVEPSCGIEPSCGTEPTCGVEPKCGVEASCGIEARQHYSHATGPIHYPSQMVSPQMPSHPVQTPTRVKPTPKPNVKPTPGPMIPAPVPEDSTVDPFRDDAVSQTRPRVRAASQRISSHASTPTAEKALHFDPQAAIRSSQVGPQRAIVRKSISAHGRVSDDQPTPAPQPSAQLTKKSTRKLESKLSLESDVVPASASERSSEPAKLPPIKTAAEPFDFSSSRNPLRD